jgi:hypothetical protein
MMPAGGRRRRRKNGCFDQFPDPICMPMAAKPLAGVADDSFSQFGKAAVFVRLPIGLESPLAGFPAYRLNRKWRKTPIFRSFCDARRAKVVERRNRVSRKINGLEFQCGIADARKLADLLAFPSRARARGAKTR